MFNVVYGKVTSKKHKTWDSDGLLEIAGKSAILKVTVTLTIHFLTQRLLLLLM